MNGAKVLINPDLITLIESTPDTVVTFSNGEKVLLLTKPQELLSRIIAFRKEIGLPPVK
jgi:flagellar protein FlbD